ncbi:MAG: class I SAM-dependent methyltransferase [Candidatus Sumerlaeota bacterium]
MDTLLYVLLGVVAGFLLVYAIWRLASRLLALPCPSWIKWVVEMDNPFARVCHAEFIIEHLHLEDGMEVADIGCGPGRVTIPLARALEGRGKVTAVDVQEGMIEAVKQKAVAVGMENIEYLRTGVGEGRLGSERFDRAVLVTVLGEIPDREAAMEEIYGAMKPGGILSISEMIFDPHFQRRAIVTQLATKAGFVEQKFFGKSMAYTMHFMKPERA